MRIRGTNPAIEVNASNLTVLLGEAASQRPMTASFSLRQGASMGGSPPAFFHVVGASNAGYPSKVSLSATDIALTPSNASQEPTLSFQTYMGTERARIDGFGLTCGTLTAQRFTNLVGDYVTQNVFLPPTATALAEAFVTLSNLIVTTMPAASASGPGGALGTTTAMPQLVNNYVSSSATAAPTANALRSAYFNLSNLMATRLAGLADTVPALVAAAAGNIVSGLSLAVANSVASLPSSASSAAVGGRRRRGSWSECSPSGSNSYVFNFSVGNELSAGGSLNSAPAFAFSNDVFLTSVGDGVPRMFFSSDGATIAASAGNGNGGERMAFGWFVSDVEQDVMTLSGSGSLWVGGGANVDGALSASGAVTLCNSLGVQGGASLSSDLFVGGQINLGSNVAVTYSGSNVGINLPVGVAPVCTLHVNGAIFSEESLFALSDASVKTNIEPLRGALSKVLCIRGCSYTRTDLPATSARQIGVIAQNVSAVVPEAVHVGSDGRMSVAYGNLVALAIEAIREVTQLQSRLERRVGRMEGGRMEGGRMEGGRMEGGRRIVEGDAHSGEEDTLETAECDAAECDAARREAARRLREARWRRRGGMGIAARCRRTAVRLRRRRRSGDETDGEEICLPAPDG